MRTPDRRNPWPDSRLRLGGVGLLLALALGLTAGGCGHGPAARAAGGGTLLAGAGRPAPPPARLRSGTRLARRFAYAYARGAFARRPPRLPGAVPAVRAAVAAAARRVPERLRGLRPSLLALRVGPEGPRALRAEARIGARGAPAFSVAFGLRLDGGRWSVTSISLPD